MLIKPSPDLSTPSPTASPTKPTPTKPMSHAHTHIDLTTTPLLVALSLSAVGFYAISANPSSARYVYGALCAVLVSLVVSGKHTRHEVSETAAGQQPVAVAGKKRVRRVQKVVTGTFAVDMTPFQTPSDAPRGSSVYIPFATPFSTTAVATPTKSPVKSTPPSSPTKSTSNKAAASAPVVIVGLSTLDFGNERNVRVDVKAVDVSERGFTLCVHTWADTMPYKVDGHWVAVGEVEGVEEF